MSTTHLGRTFLIRARTRLPAAVPSWTRTIYTAPVMGTPQSYMRRHQPCPPPFKIPQPTRFGFCTSTPSFQSTQGTIHNDTSEQTYKALRTSTTLASSHFDLSRIPPQEQDQILQDFILVPDYLSEEEQIMMVQQATKKLKRALGKEVRYEDGHFDGVITRYRECSATDWGTFSSSSSPTLSSASSSETSLTRPTRTTPAEVMQSIKDHFFPHAWKWVAPHILELEAGRGGIKPHVDHLDASGQVVAGVCLGSTAVMELVHVEDSKKRFRVLLPKGAFYFQRDSVRYNYKHGIPIEPEDHQFKGTVIPKEKRISVMLRNALEPSIHGRSSVPSSDYKM